MCPASYSTDPTSVQTNRCLNCGSAVSAQFARVFGDNQNNVFGCTSCLTTTELLD